MTSTMNILSGVDFTPSDIKYSKPKVDTRGGKSVGILNAATNTATYISTPLMLTWGINDYVDDKSGRVSYDMALQFPNEEYSKEDTTSFMNNMIALEQKIKNDAITNAKEWFGKAKMSEDAVDALWTPMLKYPKDKNTLEPDTSRAPTLKVKIPYWEGEWKTELYNLEQQPIFPDPTGANVTPKDLIGKGTHVAIVIQCGGLWFANGKFGITWRLLQGVVKPKMSMAGKCHITLTSQDKKIMETQNVVENEDDEEEYTNTQPDTVSKTEVADSDNEEEIKQEVATAITEDAPKKKIVKKKIVKKSA